MASKTPSKLTHLASDVVRAITSLLSGHDIGKLWFIGDKRLHRVLSLSVNRFELFYADVTRLKWPRLIANFQGLRDLNIQVSGRILLSQELLLDGVNISDVPRGIRKLLFKFGGDFANFLEVAVNPAQDHDIYSRQRAVLKDMRVLYPELEVFGCYGVVHMDNLEGEPTCSIWPHTLQELTLRNCELNIADLACLPRMLRSLKCTIAPFQYWEGQPDVLPPHLQQLELSNVSDTHVFEHIPPHVSELILTFSLSKDVTAHGWNLFKSPRSLSTLSVTFPSFRLDIIPYIPPSLTHLKLISTRSCAIEIFNNLPERLKILDYTGPMPNRPILILEKLPPTLESLPLEFFNYIPASSWKDLPRSLKELFISAPPGEYSAHLQALPPNLTSLSIDGISSISLVTLPSTLKKLTLHNFTDNIYGTGIGHMYRLTNLTELNIEGTIDKYNLQSLNHSLQKLCLFDKSNPNMFDFTETWARGLTHLELLMDPLPYDVLKFMQDLPRTLEILQLCYSGEGLDAKILSLLPPLLRTCRLQAITFLTDEALSRLSARIQLTELEIGSAGRGCTLSEEGLRTLPKSLQLLVLPNFPFRRPAPILFRHLPYFRGARIGYEHIIPGQGQGASEYVEDFEARQTRYQFPPPQSVRSISSKKAEAEAEAEKCTIQ
jgi:hypothetical protein